MENFIFSAVTLKLSLDSPLDSDKRRNLRILGNFLIIFLIFSSENSTETIKHFLCLMRR